MACIIEVRIDIVNLDVKNENAIFQNPTETITAICYTSYNYPNIEF